MGNLCKKLGITVAILGTIGTLYSAYLVSDDFISLIISLIKGALLTAILSVILYTLGDIHKIVSIIANSTSVMSNEHKPLPKWANSNDSNWECPNCGLSNYSYETTCKCGQSKFQ